jgi:hypothetical protein
VIGRPLTDRESGDVLAAIVAMEEAHVFKGDPLCVSLQAVASSFRRLAQTYTTPASRYGVLEAAVIAQWWAAWSAATITAHDAMVFALDDPWAAELDAVLMHAPDAERFQRSETFQRVMKSLSGVDLVAEIRSRMQEWLRGLSTNPAEPARGAGSFAVPHFPAAFTAAAGAGDRSVVGVAVGRGSDSHAQRGGRGRGVAQPAPSRASGFGTFPTAATASQGHTSDQLAVVCKNWLQTGECSHGERCRFVAGHVAALSGALPLPGGRGPHSGGRRS